MSALDLLLVGILAFLIGVEVGKIWSAPTPQPRDARGRFTKAD